MTDNVFLAAVLADGEWHSRDAILALSYQTRGCGLTVHSRASDLRKKHGVTIVTRLEQNARGRVDSFYRLVTLDEAASTPSSLPAVGGAPSPLGAASSSVPTSSLAELPPGERDHGDPAGGDGVGTLLLFDTVPA